MADALVFDAVLAFPAMRVGLRIEGARVAEIRYLPPGTPESAPRGALAERAARQLERYRRDPDASFDLPVAPRGTDFQLRVWEALRRIPRGTALTYGAVAREIGGVAGDRSAGTLARGGNVGTLARGGNVGTLARAVGQACGANRLPIVIPCHRVVAASGIGGFAHSRGGYLIEAKRWLLEHEGAI
jgi:methylated-DNA-[protein]-cysteine S-methyltransferase